MSAGPQCETGQPARMAAATPSRSGNLSMPGEPLSAPGPASFSSNATIGANIVAELPSSQSTKNLVAEVGSFSNTSCSTSLPADLTKVARGHVCTHFGEAPDRWVVEHNAIFSPAVERAGREESGFRRGSWATLSLAMWSAAISFLQRRRPIQSEDVEEEVDEIQIEHQGARDGKRHG